VKFRVCEAYRRFGELDLVVLAEGLGGARGAFWAVGEELGA
jgi:hypothetical protein